MELRIRSDISDVFAKGYNSLVSELKRTSRQGIREGRRFAEDVRGEGKEKRGYLVPQSTWHEET